MRTLFKMEALKPSPSILSKLGSLVIHIEESMNSKGHIFDMITVKSIIEDEEVKEWLKAMDKLALIPKKR